MMSTAPGYSRGRSLARPSAAAAAASHSASSSVDKDVNNTLAHVPPLHRHNSSLHYVRDRTPSPVRRSPYIGGTPSPPPLSPLSRSGSIMGHPPLSPSSLGDVKKLNRSSVHHLRNLSEFSRDEDPVIGLGIQEIEREEVPGIAGRKRLARGESQKVYAGNKLWVDKQRQVIQTYEYLCHVGEAKQSVLPRLPVFGFLHCAFLEFGLTCADGWRVV
jgi:hypothetical protein